MSESTGAEVDCPLCGESFDPTVAGGWCTNSECGEWQYEGEIEDATGGPDAVADGDEDAETEEFSWEELGTEEDADASDTTEEEDASAETLDLEDPSEDADAADAETGAPEEPADAAEEPADAAEEPADAAEEPADAAEEPADAAEEPADAAEEPADAAEEPADAAEEPADAAEEPADAAEEPADVDSDDLADSLSDTEDEAAEEDLQDIELDDPSADAEADEADAEEADAEEADAAVSSPTDGDLELNEPATDESDEGPGSDVAEGDIELDEAAIEGEAEPVERADDSGPSVEDGDLELDEDAASDAEDAGSAGAAEAADATATDEQAERLSACPKCDTAVDASNSFCPDCGEDLDQYRTEDLAEILCPSCETEVDPNDKFCASCGEDLSGISSAGPAASDQGEAPEALALKAYGRSIVVGDGDTVGREVRSLLTDAGRPEDEAVRIHREHVRFVREGGTFYVVDLGENPTAANGKYMEKGDREPIAPGDEVELSDVVTLSIDQP